MAGCGERVVLCAPRALVVRREHHGLAAQLKGQVPPFSTELQGLLIARRLMARAFRNKQAGLEVATRFVGVERDHGDTQQVQAGRTDVLVHRGRIQVLHVLSGFALHVVAHVNERQAPHHGVHQPTHM
eukprot:scaffold109_cov252-Pinguiococcus_pyrenoidosus.AAC.15